MKLLGRKRLLVLVLCSASVFAATLAASRRLTDRIVAEGESVGVQTTRKPVTDRSAAAGAHERVSRGDESVGTPAEPEPRQEASEFSAIQVDRVVVAGGGGSSSGSNAGKTFNVQGTVGQVIAADTQGAGENTQSGGQYTVNGGFWNTLPVTTDSTATVPTFQFDAEFYTVAEGVNAVNVRVLRLGPAGVSTAVEVVSSDAVARQKGDYTMVVGHLSFAPNETAKTIQVLVNDDAYAEGPEFATLLLQHPDNGSVLGAPNTATLRITDNSPETTGNPIDDSRTFVGTHYHDFLYRQADTTGEDFWTQQIEACGTDTQCRAARRVAVSTAFFLSIEFQQTGYLVIRSYKAAFGNIKSNPRYARFLSDQRQVGGVVVGTLGWEQKLADNRRDYLAEFVSRPEFLAQFPQGQSANDYVDKLFQNAGVTPSTAEREAAITVYGAGDTAGRAAALASVVESGSVFNRLYNDAFVLMQYFGYLRRNPDDEPDLNFSGYDFWLQKMNQLSLPGEDMRDPGQALERVKRAEMVRAFVESLEYRQRFAGAPGGNQFGPAVSATEP